MGECKGKNRGTLPQVGGCGRGRTPPKWGKQNELYRAFLAQKKGGYNLTAKHGKVIQALLTCPTQATAAAAAGVSLTTLKRYLNNDEFQREYQRAITELIAEAVAQAKQSLSPALSTLREVMESEEQNGQVRVSAARSLLEYGMKLIEQNDILVRLNELERLMGGGTNSHY